MKKVFVFILLLVGALGQTTFAAAPVNTLGGVPSVSSISTTGMLVTTLGTGSNQFYRIINTSNFWESVRALTNFSGPSISYDAVGANINWWVPNQNIIVGCDTNLTFSNIRSDAAVFVDFVQTNAGGWTVSWPGTALPLNQTNQAGTLNIATNNAVHTIVKFWKSGGRTNFAMNGPDHPFFAYAANADYTTNGKTFVIINKGVNFLYPANTSTNGVSAGGWTTNDFIFTNGITGTVTNDGNGKIVTTMEFNVHDVSTYFWLEEFNTTIQGNGTLGDKRWYNNNQASGSCMWTNGLEKPTQHIGIQVLLSATNAGSCATICQGDTPSMGYGYLPFALGVMTNWQAKFIFNMLTSNSVGFYMGFARASNNTNAPTDGMFLRYDCWAPDSTFAHGCVNNSSAVTTNSTGIATTNTWHTWTISNYGVSNSMVFQLDSSTPWTNTVNIPTNTLTPYIMLCNRTHNTNSMVYLDRISIGIKSLIR